VIAPPPSHPHLRGNTIRIDNFCFVLNEFYKVCVHTIGSAFVPVLVSYSSNYEIFTCARFA